MKKILAFVLAAVMVLGLVATAVSAAGNPAYDGYSVSMGEDISLNVYFKDLDPTVTYTAKVNGEAAKLTVDGTAGVVKIAELTPVMVGTEYTVELYNGEEKVAETDKAKSVLGYCEWALTNMSLSNDVHTLVVNLLNYAAAIQAYENVENTATSWLSDLQKALAITGTAPVNPYAATDDETGKAIVWDGATIVLGESIAYRFFFKAETMPEDVKFVATLGGVETPVGAYVNDAVKGYYVDFTALTPADLFKDVVIKAVGADGAEYSVAKTFSAERYASYAAAGENDAVKNAMSAILNYSKAAEAYNAVALSNPNHEFAKQPLRDIENTGELSAHENYVMSKLTAQDYLNDYHSKNDANVPASIQLSYLLPWFYKEAGIDLELCTGFEKGSYSDANKAWNGNGTKGVEFYKTIMVVASRATSIYGASLAKEELQIGDIFVGWRSSGVTGKTNYYGCAWVGDGFIVLHDDWQSTSVNNMVATDMKYEELAEIQFSTAFVLRVNQVMRDITSGPLTENEKSIIANLDDANWEKNGNSTQLNGLLTWVYKEAGVDVTKHSDYVSLTYSGANTAMGNATKAGYTYYNAMLVEGTRYTKGYTGLPIDYADLQVGDIFVGWYGKFNYVNSNGENKTASDYYGAVWQGDGFYLLADNKSLNDDQNGEVNNRYIGTAKYIDLMDITWDACYVLRPSQLANQAG